MTSHSELPSKRPGRRRRQRGQALIEMSLVIIPMLAIIFIFMDIAWGLYLKATMEHAVRVGCRYGITNSLTDPYQPSLCGGSTTMTDCIGQHVISAANGLLDPATVSVPPQGAGQTCSAAACVLVQYFSQTGAPAAGQLNQGGNIIEVTITGFRKDASNNPITGFQISTLVAPFIAPNSTWYTSASSADTLSSVLSYPNP